MAVPTVDQIAAQQQNPAQQKLEPGGFLKLGIGLLLIVFIGALIFMLGESWINFAIAVMIVSFIALAVVMMMSKYKEMKKENKGAYEAWHEKVQKAALLSCPENIKDRKVILTGQKGFGGNTLGHIVGYIRLKDTRTKDPSKVFVHGIYYIEKSKWGLYSIAFLRPFIQMRNVFFYDSDIFGGDLMGDVSLTGVSTIPVGEWNWVNSIRLDAKEITQNITKENVDIQLAQDAYKFVSQVAFKASFSDPDFLKMIAGRSNMIQPPGSQPPGGV